VPFLDFCGVDFAGWRAVASVFYPASTISLSVTLTAYGLLGRDVELALGSTQTALLLLLLHAWNVLAGALIGWLLAMNPLYPLPQVPPSFSIITGRNPNPERSLSA
jgi:hypothetical protein